MFFFMVQGNKISQGHSLMIDFSIWSFSHSTNHNLSDSLSFFFFSFHLRFFGLGHPRSFQKPPHYNTMRLVFNFYKNFCLEKKTRTNANLNTLITNEVSMI